MVLGRRQLIRLGTAAALVAVLVAFVMAVWSWGRQGRDDATFGLSGPTTTLTVASDDLRPARAGAMAALISYLGVRGIPLLMVSVGDARPAVVALGPSERVAWLSRAVPPGSVLLVEGSYTARRWASRHTLAGFVPPGVQVTGLTPGPPHQHYLQFVVGSVKSPPAAEYVLGTRDPREVEDLVGLLAAAGAPTSPPADVPTASSWRDPTVVAIVLMLASAVACLALDWSLLAGRLMPRLQLARRHGASRRAVVRGALSAATPALLAGAVTGAAATLLIPMSQEGAQPGLALGSWVLVALVAGLLVAVVWCVVVVGATWMAVRDGG